MDTKMEFGVTADPTTGRLVEDKTQVVAAEVFGDDPFKAKVPGGILGVRNRKLFKDEAWTAARRKEQEATFKWSHANDPCVVVNMNPFPLSVNGGMLFGYQIPACPPEKDYVFVVLRDTKWTTQDQGAGLDNVPHFYPWPCHPSEQACEFIRAYNIEEESGGVVLFIGSSIPEDLDVEVEMPIARTGDEEDISTRIERVPRNLKKLFDEARSKRNIAIMRRLEKAVSWYNNDDTRPLVNDNHRADAHMAKAIGLIEQEPAFCMQKLLIEGEKRPDPCPACGATPKQGALICKECNGYVFNVFEAYKHGIIEFGHVSMDRCDAEELEKVLNEKERRDARKAKLGQKYSFGEPKS